MSIPEDVRSLVWYLPTAKLDEDRNAHDLIVCTLYLGTMEQIGWVLRRYGVERVAEAVRRDFAGSRVLSPPAARLWSGALRVPESLTNRRVIPEY